MSRYVDIEWPELKAKVTAELLDDWSPSLCNFLWKNLPIESISSQAILCENLMVCPHGLVTEIKPQRTEQLTEQKEGRVDFNKTELIIDIVWGRPSEPAVVTPVAQVREQDLSILRSVGRAVWESFYWTKRPIRVIFKKSSLPGGI